MSLNMERFTRPAEEAIYLAHKIVSEHRQQKMEAEHLLLALVRVSEGSLPEILGQTKLNKKALDEELERYIEKLDPANSANRDVYLSYSCEQCIRKAEYEADRMRDEFLGPEHLVLGILANTGTEASTILRAQGLDGKALTKVIESVRGGQRITSRGGDPSELEMVHLYCHDLVGMARENKFDPVIGRDEEVRRVIQVLSRRSKNNPVLIGEPGVGKTAIIEGLAQRIYQGDVPENMKNASLMSLDLAAMVAGAKYRGEFEDRLKGLLREIETVGKHIILFIDELHTLVGAGASEGALDASNMLKPALARGVLRCVGATTITEYKKYIERDAALERRFQQVLVREPSVESCIGILRGLKGKYEVHHGVRIKDSAIIASAKLAARYIPDRYLPDKAIDLIDEAASKVRIEIDSMPTVIDQAERKALQLEIERAALTKEDDDDSRQRVRELDREISRHRRQAEELKAQWHSEREAIGKIRALKEEIERTQQQELEAQRSGNLELAAKLKYGVQDALARELADANKLLSDSEGGRLLKEEIDEEDIAQVVSKWTGIPVARMMMDEQVKLLNMEKALSQGVVGQKRALLAVSNAIRRARTGIQDPNRPLGSFIFMGPTGVGKTELAKKLAHFLFDDEKAMIRMDMSEYMEKHAVSRLVGAPPGYTGYDEGGILTEAVHRKPYSVILFDEVEKGHPEIFNILLQILDEGILTDSRGIKVDFKNSIVILTTNLGSEVILKTFSEQKKVPQLMARKILLTRFRPELLNRLDEVIVFEPLGMDSIERLVALQVDKLSGRLEENGGTILRVNQEAQRHLAQRGFDAEFGARPLKRLIQRELEDVLAYKILDGTIHPGDQIEVRLSGEQLTFHRIKAVE
ncbi:MAG: AAA family ATPase [bacterium]|nr:AAA family ATPase [bacterium]